MTQATPPILQDDDSRGGKALARAYERGTRIEPHRHAWAQVLYAVSGVMWVELEREALVVPPQRAVWLPLGCEHAIHMMSAVQMRNLYVRTVDLGASSVVFEVNALLRELIVALAEQGDGDDADYLDAAYRLAGLELQRAPHYTQRIPLPEAGDRRLQALCRAVMAEPSVAISFEQHAAEVGASVRTLSRLFDKALGMGFNEWRRQVQLAIAVSRLAEGQAVGEIAHALGYRPSSFSEMFRRELGVAPSAFRA